MADQVKPYDQRADAQHNGVACLAAASFLCQHGCKQEVPVLLQEKKYKAGDFNVVSPSGKIILVEVERKLSWTRTGSWQGYETVDIPHRKVDSQAEYFIMTNFQCDTLLCVKMDRVMASPVKEKDTIYTKSEKFFAVAPSFCTFATVKDGKWHVYHRPR